MDLSHPIRGIIPTLDGPVLEVLAQTTRGLSGREVQRLAGTGSPRGVRLVLTRLVREGLVRAEEHPNAILYTANRAHLAWPAIESLTRLRSQLLERLRTAISEWRVAPLHASLFGSAARGDGSSESDIDLLLIRPDGVGDGDETWQGQVDTLRETAHALTGNRCQMLDIDRERLAQHIAARDPLVDEWLRDEVLLVGTHLRSLIDGLGVGVRG